MLGFYSHGIWQGGKRWNISDSYDRWSTVLDASSHVSFSVGNLFRLWLAVSLRGYSESLLDLASHVTSSRPQCVLFIDHNGRKVHLSSLMLSLSPRLNNKMLWQSILPFKCSISTALHYRVPGEHFRLFLVDWHFLGLHLILQHQCLGQKASYKQLWNFVSGWHRYEFLLAQTNSLITCSSCWHCPLCLLSIITITSHLVLNIFLISTPHSCSWPTWRQSFDLQCPSLSTFRLSAKQIRYDLQLWFYWTCSNIFFWCVCMPTWGVCVPPKDVTYMNSSPVRSHTRTAIAAISTSMCSHLQCGLNLIDWWACGAQLAIH